MGILNKHETSDGLILQADVTDPDTAKYVKEFLEEKDIKLNLITSDPPYGKIVAKGWDKTNLTGSEFAQWMCDWTKLWSDETLDKGGSFYVWGGIGKPGFRPFFEYMPMVEDQTNLHLHNLITWSKKRGYGVQHNYLYTREECAFWVKDSARPNKFNVPYLDVKRGYAGFNKKYPAKSEYKRLTNVWTHITEVMRGKDHETQKAEKLADIQIETHTDEGEWVMDLFAGSGTVAKAAKKLNRKYIMIEADPVYFDYMVDKLK